MRHCLARLHLYKAVCHYYSQTCEPCQVEMREKFHSFSTLSETADLPHLYRGKNRFYHGGNAVSHPRVYGENPGRTQNDRCIAESSPRVRGKYLLTRLNAPPTYISHSLYAMDELRILLNGDPQAGYPTLLVLTGNTKATRPFRLTTSPVSHRRGIATHIK